MTAITFDTMEFIEQLKAAGVPEEQARGHVKAFATAMRQVEEGHLGELATKRDIKELELEIEKVRREIAEAKVDIIKWVVGASGVVVALIKWLPGGH
ncbi:MAG: DUF1640 domain-containing protein [Magnetococcales bacterium]|nr:DUF1640 domain-containing protein [Magnetococcales bacterium]